MKQPDLNNLTEEQRNYIFHLESAISGSSNLLSELNLICDSYALKLAEIRQSGDLMSIENLDLVMSFIDKAAKFKSLISAEKKKSTKEAKEEDSTNPIDEKIPPISDSIFEITQKRLKEKMNGNH